MKLSDFRFEVPQRLIATQPLEPRSSSRMMTIDRIRKDLKDSCFSQLPNFLKPGDLLVFNETFVIPARFFGRRKSGGVLEGLFLQSPGPEVRVWIKGRVNSGERIFIDDFGDVEVKARNGKDAILLVDKAVFTSFLRRRGAIPIPPYVQAERERRGEDVEAKEDRVRYQSLCARDDGLGYSVAAPTASLHFDQNLLSSLERSGIELCRLQLHIGEGTFAPVAVQNLGAHQMHEEEVGIFEAAWSQVVRTRKRGERVIAVGTTVCRALESFARLSPEVFLPTTFRTSLFIRPPFEFLVVDGLITNFHWPDSTLVVLVASFLEAVNGKTPADLTHQWRTYYEEAVRTNYRFFSFGDGMLIL